MFFAKPIPGHLASQSATISSPSGSFRPCPPLNRRAAAMCTYFAQPPANSTSCGAHASSCVLSGRICPSPRRLTSQFRIVQTFVLVLHAAGPFLMYWMNLCWEVCPRRSCHNGICRPRAGGGCACRAVQQDERGFERCCYAEPRRRAWSYRLWICWVRAGLG